MRLLLDEHGVEDLDAVQPGALDFPPKPAPAFGRWPTESTPSGLWTGPGNLFFTREGDTLHQRGWDHGDRVDAVVEGIVAPRDVLVGLYWTCARSSKAVASPA